MKGAHFGAKDDKGRVQKGKENFSQNSNLNSVSQRSLIKESMNKFSKFIERKKWQLLCSNNINVRTNLGSNDSKQAAPAQRKYQLPNQLGSSHHNAVILETKASPTLSTFLARN